MWIEYPLTLRFVTPLCGGVPRHDDVVRPWIEARAATEAKLRTMPDAKELDEVVAEHVETIDKLDDAIEEAIAKVWVGFSRDETGLFVRAANVRAHLKDCAQVLGRGMKSATPPNGCKAIKQFKAKLTDALYVKDDRLYILDGNGKLYAQPTGFRDATMSVMTAQGPRQCMKRIDYCKPASLKCTLQLLESSEVCREHLIACLDYGKVHGFGQDRSLQFGRYEYELGEVV